MHFVQKIYFSLLIFVAGLYSNLNCLAAHIHYRYRMYTFALQAHLSLLFAHSLHHTKLLKRRTKGETHHKMSFYWLCLYLLLLFSPCPLSLSIYSMALTCLWHVGAHMTVSNDENNIITKNGRGRDTQRKKRMRRVLEEMIKIQKKPPKNPTAGTEWYYHLKRCV